MACTLIKEGVGRALARLGTHRALPLPACFAVEVQFQHRIQAEMLDYLPWVRRSGPKTVSVDLGSMQQTMKFLSFIVLYHPAGLHDLK